MLPLVRCSEASVVIPSRSLNWVPVPSSSWHNVLLFTHPLRRSARIRRDGQYNLTAWEAAFTCMLVPIQLDTMHPVTLIIVTQQLVMHIYLNPCPPPPLRSLAAPSPCSASPLRPSCRTWRSHSCRLSPGTSSHWLPPFCVLRGGVLLGFLLQLPL